MGLIILKYLGIEINIWAEIKNLPDKTCLLLDINWWDENIFILKAKFMFSD